MPTAFELTNKLVFPVGDPVNPEHGGGAECVQGKSVHEAAGVRGLAPGDRDSSNGLPRGSAHRGNETDGHL